MPLNLWESNMNIYEYQAKSIFKKFGLNVPDGLIAYTPLEAQNVAKKLSSDGPWIVKAQVRAGGRNIGKFMDKRAGKKGGIRFSKTLEEVYNNANEMIENRLITAQTSNRGMLVSRVYVEEYIKTFQKFYFSLVVNSATASVMLLLAPVTPNGDDDIIEKATHSPSQILKIDLGCEKSISAADISQIADFMQYNGTKSHLKSFLNKLLNIFYNYDATKLEINPIGIDKDNTLWALDAKIVFDDNALYRHPDILRLRPMAEIEEREVVVAKFGFDYKELNTGIGIITNGNGVALNIITEAQKCNADIACSLNIKGGVDRDKIAASIKLIMTNPSVDGIFIDIVGGFTRCNLVADGIIAVANDLGLNIPIVVRFEGTNKDEAVNILNASQLPIQIADSTYSGIMLAKEAIAEDL